MNNMRGRMADLSMDDEPIPLSDARNYAAGIEGISSSSSSIFAAHTDPNWCDQLRRLFDATRLSFQRLHSVVGAPSIRDINEGPDGLAEWEQLRKLALVATWATRRDGVWLSYVQQPKFRIKRKPSACPACEYYPTVDIFGLSEYTTNGRGRVTYHPEHFLMEAHRVHLGGFHNLITLLKLAACVGSWQAVQPVGSMIELTDKVDEWVEFTLNDKVFMTENSYSEIMQMIKSIG